WGNVYMVCRNKERGEAVVSKVQSATGNKNVYFECFVKILHNKTTCCGREGATTTRRSRRNFKI
ncbi:hypothetical protein MKW98_022356, partial [Papaver atlanticum]